MSAKENFVWRFKLDKTECKLESTNAAKVRMVRQQIQNLLNLVLLLQDGKRLRPSSFSFIGDSRIYQIFEDEGNIERKTPLFEGKHKHFQKKGGKV